MSLIGKKIVAIRPMSEKEYKEEGWEKSSLNNVIVLDDGTTIYALRDEEANGPGVLVAQNGKSGFYVTPMKKT